MGALGWWALTVLFVIYVFFALDKDKSLFWPIFLLILYVLFTQFLARVDVFGFAAHHPVQLVLYILGYFVVGFMWSFVKWWLLVSTVADKYRERRKVFLADIDKRLNQEALDEKWRHIMYNDDLGKPKLSKEKKKVTLWIMYWPMSMLWSLLDDFIKKMIRHLIIKFQKVYQYLTDRAFKDIDKTGD
jgi:hypothetical protein